MAGIRETAKQAASPLMAIGAALCVGFIVLVLLGEHPRMLVDAIANTLFTDFGLGFALYHATPLIFTGLAVAVSFHAGLFNIGAEGQLYIGSVAIIVFGYFFPELPRWIAIPTAVMVSMIAGGCWGAIAGILKATRGSHEVIVTILLNFIAIAIVEYLILYPFHNPLSQNPESVVLGNNYRIALLSELAMKCGLEWFVSTPVNVALFIAVAFAFLVHLLLFRTTLGFEMRTVGMNPVASHYHGISVAKTFALSLFISGMLSGLVGVNEVLGHQHRVIEGFSPGYGFTGIAVALVGKNRPLGIVLSALFFGVLHNSSRELEFLSDKVTKEISLVLQAIMIALIAGERLFTNWRFTRGERPTDTLSSSPKHPEMPGANP